jgi:hypothetical protein
MSKQQAAKEAQGYRTELQNCGNCKHRTAELTLPLWMRTRNERHGIEYTLERHGVESNKRCGIGGFAIKQTATCTRWEAA